MRLLLGILRLAAFWALLGASVGGFFAFMLTLSGWMMVASMAALFAALSMLVWVLGHGVTRISSPPVIGADGVPAQRHLARLEQVDEAGFVLSGQKHLLDVVVTLLDAPNSPRQVRLRQFVNVSDLPAVNRGDYVVVALPDGADAANPRAGWFLDLRPPPQYADALRSAPLRYQYVTAPPPAGTAPPRLTRHRTRLLRVLGVAVVGFAVGFVGLVAVTPLGLPRMVAWVGMVPDRITGDVHGTFDSPMLEDDVESLQAAFAGRDVIWVGFYGGYVVADAVAVTDPEGEDSYTYRYGAVNRTSTGTRTTEATFSMDDVRPAAIRRAVDQVLETDPDADFSYVRVSRGFGTVSHGLRITVYTTGDYGGDTYEFDGHSGEALPPPS